MSSNITLPVGSEQEGQRIDKFLQESLPGMSRSQAQKWIVQGLVRIGEKGAGKNDKLKSGMVVSVELPIPPEELDGEPDWEEILHPTTLPQPQEIPLDIVYEDAHLIVVNKPKGMVVHPAAGHPDGTLVNALLYHCGESLSGINGALRPGIVHRIDRDTSGLIIAAKNDKAHLALAEQLQDHSLYREYEAVCVGNLKDESGTVDAPIFRHPTDRKKMAVNKLQGRRAVTHWSVLEHLNGYTHIQCRLETGRTHQIRVHMAYIGHPLLGDVVYGSKKPWPGLAGQCLHARRLSFIHPRTGERVTLECPLPDWFEAVLTKLRGMV